MGRPKRPARKRYAQRLFLILLTAAAAWAAFVLIRAAAAKTYVITDGSRIITCTTYRADPVRVLEAAGIALGEHDTFFTDGKTTITLSRAQRIDLYYHGQHRQIYSAGETVAQLLKRCGIPLREGDRLSCEPDSLTHDGMVLWVDAVLTRQEVYTAAIPHERSYFTAPDLPRGREEVLIAGRDGELQRRAEVTYINGTEAQRKILSESVTIPAVTELVAIGTGPEPEEKQAEAELVIGDGYILLPTGELLTYVKTDTVRATGYTHTDAGCDMITSTGTTVQRGTVAVDPRFIPYGTRMFIVTNDGSFVYGLAVAEDCGGAIKRDRMDLYFPTYNECIQFGYRRCTIYFLG